MYSKAVENRGRISYDDKPVLLGYLADNQPNSTTHAYGHYSLINEVQVEEVADPAATSNDLHIMTP